MRRTPDKNSFIFFTDEQKEKAVNTNLEHFLKLHGYTLKPSGHEQRLILGEHDKSITVSGNTWYDHAEEKGWESYKPR